MTDEMPNMKEHLFLPLEKQDVDSNRFKSKHDWVRNTIERILFIWFQVKRYTPKLYYIKSLNVLTFQLYDCSYVVKHVSKTHLFDLLLDMYPKNKWLSFVGFQFWFPYTWEEIKSKVHCKIIDKEIDDFIFTNNQFANQHLALKSDVKDLLEFNERLKNILKDHDLQKELNEKIENVKKHFTNQEDEKK